jgi:hypothetical protein
LVFSLQNYCYCPRFFLHFILFVAGVPAISALTNAGVTAIAGAYCVWQEGIPAVVGVPSVGRRPSNYKMLSVMLLASLLLPF